jgi:uncharacterized protein
MKRKNPFIYGEVVRRPQFVDREEEIQRLQRDMGDAQKVFLLSPRRFGKSSLVGVVFEQLEAQGIHTATISVSSYSSYAHFLEKFAEKVIRAGGPWQRAKNWIGRFVEYVKPQASLDLQTGEISLSFGRGGNFRPEPIAPEVFALPGLMADHGGFQMAVCLDEFQQISKFDGASVEGALRSAVQRQRKVGYVFAGSQPSMMKQMLAPDRPFHKSGSSYFLEKIGRSEWEHFIRDQFRERERTITRDALEHLFSVSDLIPYDVQRIAHELWDYAELGSLKTVSRRDVDEVIHQLSAGQSDYYERVWEQLPQRQKAVLGALAARGASAIYSEAIRNEYRLGPASSVRTALASLDGQDLIDQYKGSYFFVDPIFAVWIRSLG